MSPLLKFFLLTFLISWTLFFLAAIPSLSEPAAASVTPLQSVLGFLGTITPAFVSSWIAYRNGYPGGLKNLVSGVFKWRVEFKWYLFAIGFMIMIKLSVALIHKLITGEWPIFGKEDLAFMFMAVIFSAPVQAGEEIGWRGFALPLMSEKIGLSASAILIGIIWAFWHLPIFFIQGADVHGQSFPLFLIQVILISIVMSWLYFRTNGSLLLTMLLHAAINNTKDIVPSAVAGAQDPWAFSTSLVAWLTVILLFIFGVIFLFQMKGVRSIPTS